MTGEEMRAWATAYIEANQDPYLLKTDGDHPLWWAVKLFLNMGADVSYEDCWIAIIEILSRGPPDNVIGILAAGPLQDLIEARGAEFIDRIELEARRSRAFRHLLGGVWESSNPDVWAHVEKAPEVSS